MIDTLRNKVVDLSVYENSPNELMLGQVASLGGFSSNRSFSTLSFKTSGCSAWLILATVFRLPVASSHSIVGAILGFTLLMHGTRGIHSATVIEIIASWIISPVSFDVYFPEI